MNRINKILCVLPKYSFGDIKKGISPEYNAIYKPIKKNFKNVFFFDSLKSSNLKKINSDLVSNVKKLRPDLIFFAISSYEINIETLVKIKKNRNCLLLNWCSDDEWRFDQHSKLLSKYFDCMITTSEKAKLKYLKLKRFSILSHWGCPDEWIGKPIISKKCKYDVSFVGKSYFDRKNVIEYLKSNNIKVKCFGVGWGTKILKDSEISKIFRISKISLNFSSTRGFRKQLKARVFEVTGSGGFLMTEYSDNLLKFFNTKQISVFKNNQELLKNINKLLNNFELRDKMTFSSSKISKNYSYSSIIKKIISKIKTTKFKKENNNIKFDNFKNLNKFELIFLKFYKFLSISILNFFFDNKKSIRISRRVLFEIEWRARQERTYSQTGWCFNLFDIV